MTKKRVSSPQNPKQSKTVAVTGATGFVGRAVIEALKQQGHTVVALVRTTSGHKAQAIENEGVTLRPIGAIEHHNNWSDTIRDCECVVHLAAKVHVKSSSWASGVKGLFDPVNVGATYRLARACAEQGTHLIFISSSKVYGETNPTNWQGRFKPFSEADPLRPKNAYAHSKAGAEALLNMMSESLNLKCTILRPPLVYGAGVGANMKALVSAMKAGKRLPFSKVSNTRSFISVNNLADAIVAVLEDQRAMGQTFNVADKTQLSTPQLIKMIAQTLGCPSGLFPIPPILLKVASMMVLKAALYDKLCANMALETQKITTELSWSPPFETADEIKKMIFESGSEQV